MDRRVSSCRAVAAEAEATKGIEEANREFWQAKTLDDHVAEQGIIEPQSLDRFHASDAWPEDDDLEEFLRDLEAQSHPPNGDRRF